jgi:hypothetical protein
MSRPSVCGGDMELMCHGRDVNGWVRQLDVSPTCHWSVEVYVSVFLQIQESSLFKPTVTSSTSTICLSLHNSKAGLAWFSVRLQFYVLTLIQMGSSHLNHILTLHSHKPLVY